MASFYVWVTFGLCLLKLCLTETQFNVSCRYRGVFHVEKNGRYSLTRTEAADLCRALNSTLSTLEQLEKAHELGFETCRYGFIVGHIAIPRINPYHLCAANHTGIYKLSANTTGRYDAYCYNATETRDKACEPIERIDTSFLNNQSEIVIDNEDGSRYNADGTRHSGDSSTSGVDDENVGSGSSHDTTPVDTSIKRSSPSYYGSVTPVSHLSDHSSGGGEKDFPVKNSDDEISPTSTDISLVTGFNDFAKEDDEWHRGSTTLVTSENEKRQGPTQHPLLHSAHSGWISQAQNPANTTGSTEHQEFTLPGENDIEKKTSYTAVTASIDVLEPEDVTQEVWAPRVIVTALATPDGARHEDSTQPPLSSGNEAGWGTEGITHPTDAPGGEVLHGLTPASTNEAGDDSLLMGTITESADIVSREEATKEPLAPSTQPGSESEQANTTDGSYVNLVPGVFSDIDDRHNQLQTPLPPRSTSIIGGDHGSRKGNVEPTSNPGENATTTITSQPRSAQVPEWLIIVAALLALALILAVCIAVSSRRRCGQKKKLVINNGKGAVEDRKTSELNGDASKSQEMVHLVHKEQSNDRTGASDEFLTIDETQNHQELDMKSGV
ncbi:CD44 antigen isoform X44 [Cygnus olor]|uniref:CD44 antigen isoform X44 n=1 Tax=Cygnus olor TaxID=8869 RepID=UPI001ADE6D18|nr:CD44 antigen isoform X44 [Cygnus olor]